MALVASLKRSFLSPIFLLAALLELSPRQAGAQAAEPSLEYKVKAAYLLNFTRYVEWPDHAFALPGAPILICVVGADPFGAVLEKTVAGRTSHGRPLGLLRLEPLDERLPLCHVIFISRSASGLEPAIVERVAGQPILTVGEATNFLAVGGIINLLIVGGSVHFEVNMGAAERVGFKISSRMLPLAKRVITKGGQSQ